MTDSNLNSDLMMKSFKTKPSGVLDFLQGKQNSDTKNKKQDDLIEKNRIIDQNSLYLLNLQQ